jgi:hypothetical protein
MRRHRAPGFIGLASKLVFAVILMAGLAGSAGLLRKRVRQVSGWLAATVFLWLFGSSLVGLGLLLLLLTVGQNFLTNFGISLAFCMAPGAILFVLGWAIYRNRSQEGQGGAAQGAAQTAGNPHQRSNVPMFERSNVTTAPSRTQAASSPQAQPASARRGAEVEKAPPQPAYYRERAVAYRRRIQTIIRKRRPGPIADLLATIPPKLERWEERVGQLAERLAAFENDSIIQRDIREVPGDIGRLERQMETETDPEIGQQIMRTLAAHREHEVQLEALARLMRRTRLQLDDSLAAMGTIYSQVQVVDAMDIDSAQATRISEEVQEQADRLNDLLSALADVYRQPDETTESARRIRLERGGLAR